jgi:hypothetical protein
MHPEPIVRWDEPDLPEPPPLGDPTALAESQARFPRGRLELEILETLRQVYPMQLTPLQVTAMVRAPHTEVRTILHALYTLGTLGRLNKGYYRHKPHVTGGEHG